MLLGNAEGFGVVVPKHQCWPDKPAGYWQLQEEIKVAHITPDVQDTASTCQPVFQKYFILWVLSNLPRVLPKAKTSLPIQSTLSLLEAVGQPLCTGEEPALTQKSWILGKLVFKWEHGDNESVLGMWHIQELFSTTILQVGIFASSKGGQNITTE